MDCCEICGEKKIKHINANSSINSNDISFNNININLNQTENKIDIIRVKTNKEEKCKCKICEEIISKEEEIKNKCEQCNSCFCSECLYLNIKELIKNGKYSLFCPECKFVYTKEKINQILSFNMKDKEEVNNLKNLLEKSNTKEIILSNPELMFCPIVNCDGFAKKNNNENYNICTKGHKFCIKCGESWHEEGKCKEEENVDKLFDEYYQKYDLKNCPYCHIVTFKNGGCNHMECKYCGKHWCWLCQEIFISKEEHYGNENSPCFNMMMNNDNELIICSKCENEIGGNDIFRTFECDHIICKNCYKEYLLERSAMILFPIKLLNCIIPGCNGIVLVRYIWFIEFIEGINNERLIKKYRTSILFLEYLINPFFQREYEKYLELLYEFYKLISKIFDCFRKYDLLYCFFQIVGYIFGLIFLPIYIIIIPIFIHFAIKDLYYFKLLPEIKEKYKSKLIFVTIVLGEEILSLVFLFPLIAWHYIYLFFFPILSLVVLIRKFIINNY